MRHLSKRSLRGKSRSTRTKLVQVLRLAPKPRASSARSKFSRKKLRNRTGRSASSTRSTFPFFFHRVYRCSYPLSTTPDLHPLTRHPPGSAKPTSSPVTTNAKYKPSSSPATSGKPSTKRWPRNTPTPRRSSTTSSRRSVTSDLAVVSLFCLLTVFSRVLSRASISSLCGSRFRVRATT